VGFTDDIDKERMDFVERWARFVVANPDREWSRQQNVVINSALRSSDISLHDFLRMKD
jgi:hypothetical protein